MKSLLEASGGTLLMDIVKFFTLGSDKKPLSKPEEDEIYLGGSISNKTKQLVMTFPVLCDNTLPPSTASMINRANERNIVTMLQLLFSSISVSGKDGAKVLGQLHKNLSISSSMDDVIGGIDDFVNQNSNFTESAPVRDGAEKAPPSPAPPHRDSSRTSGGRGGCGANAAVIRFSGSAP